ncbi:MAG: AAA family ATPase [Gammaproteobacteria bacterium]|nr:AAA family ATPase [Gammaproteobacteria bacterium]
MKIQRLDIENFRGIRKMQIDLHPQLNVFAGKNGIGKTTILNALGRTIDIALLNHVTGNERQNVESDVIIKPYDIRVGAEHSRISLQFSLEGKQINTTVSSKPEEMASDLISHFPGAGIWLPYRTFIEERSLFAGIYRPSEQTRNMISGMDPMAGLIVQNTTRFAHAFTWISQQEAWENNQLRKFIDSGKEFGKDPFEKDKTLQLVKNVIADITGFSGLFDDMEKRAFTLRKSLGSEEEVLLFSQLSSGEQHLVAFVATIAVFLAANFPEAEDPLHSEVVFMVDAIELHLHPSWQREIIPRLLAAFPNCQFIVTTHSPQVLGNIKPESVFILKRTDDDITYEKPDESYGMTMDRLLELVMEDVSRPAESIREQLEILFEHISRKEFDKTSDIVKSLKKDIPTDPDLIRAEMLLHRKGMGL